MFGATPAPGMQPKKNKICPACNAKMGFSANKRTCDHCGTIYHRECLDARATMISGKSATLLFPNQHDKIIQRARQLRIDRLPVQDTRVYREGIAKVMAMPESEVLQDYKERLCPGCADEVRRTAPQVGKNLELARRYEEAAMVFDDLGMFEDSGRIREVMNRPRSPVEKERVEREKIVERQVVKVRCRYCAALNDDVRRTCESCGANL
ncbi:MAG: hypothetical protein QG582_672 [Candidatus Thermoplasmatota archaeon]|nr:hypothetical protein [Candidatus Thermoplasmatota archaeon]